MTKSSIASLLKEVARLVIFSIPGAFILVLTNNPSLAGSYGVPILYVLRAWDKAIHENKDTPSQGLLPF